MIRERGSHIPPAGVRYGWDLSFWTALIHEWPAPRFDTEGPGLGGAMSGSLLLVFI